MIFIDFNCPTCGSWQRAADHLVGRVLGCSSCGGNVTIPAESNLSPLPVSVRLEQASSEPPNAEPEAADADDLFFHHIRKSARQTSRHW